MRMPGQRPSPIVLVALIAAAGCTSAALPTLPSSEPPPPGQAAEIARGEGEEVQVLANNPTDAYALVARGVHKCWFGAQGALKTTHVFHAEADPPARGGAAELVLHERDDSLRDKRGARAFRVSFTVIPAGVRVGVEALKMERQLAQIMARDVMAWAKGGDGCSLPVQSQPPAPVTIKREVKPAQAR